MYSRAALPSRSTRTKSVLLPLALTLLLGAYWLELHLPRLKLVGVVGVIGHHDRRAADVLAQPAPAGAHHAHHCDGQSEPAEVAGHAPRATGALGPWGQRWVPGEGVDVACGGAGQWRAWRPAVDDAEGGYRVGAAWRWAAERRRGRGE